MTDLEIRVKFDLVESALIALAARVARIERAIEISADRFPHVWPSSVDLPHPPRQKED